MANENNTRLRLQVHKRRKPGVSVLAMIALIIISLLMGGLVGFSVARKTDPSRIALSEANTRVMQLENMLTMIGFSPDEDDPEEWLYERNGQSNAIDELSGAFADDGDEPVSDLWSDASAFDGQLSLEGDPVVVAEFDGGQLMSDEVIDEYNEQLTTQVFAGYSASQISDQLLSAVMSYLVTDKIIAAKADELGLRQLTDDDRAQIEKEAAENYEDLLDFYSAFVDSDGKTPEEVRAATAEYMASDGGITPESLRAELTDTWWAQKYFDYVVKDVSVTDEEVQAHYQELLEDQKTDFADYPEDFEYAHINEEIIVYRPEGYRAVRDILISFESDSDSDAAADLMEQLDALDPAADGEAIQNLRSQLDALFAPLEARAQEALEKLQTGTGFTELMDEYGCDELLSEEPLRSAGYYISADSYINSEEYVEGSMMLETPGQISTPLRSTFGVHLVEYLGEVPSGEVPLDQVAEAVRAETLALKQSEYYETQREALLEQANVKYYPERLQ